MKFNLIYQKNFQKKYINLIQNKQFINKKIIIKVLYVSGILKNDIGFKIEIEMLILNYDVYCVYQDYLQKIF